MPKLNMGPTSSVSISGSAALIDQAGPHHLSSLIGSALAPSDVSSVLSNDLPSSDTK